uniref:AlNc14C632G12299 protein n=1 Tax=Albugo laibachii Nc14 TaxID=890382 RepID=F0X1J6_9STRA|nr:AlNc14C632G12299 [Albugo laibachii Nc14]|eukprot:CCA27686.1 AlNc14C632G12299 [Albugo laibachii Nc14]
MPTIQWVSTLNHCVYLFIEPIWRISFKHEVTKDGKVGLKRIFNGVQVTYSRTLMQQKSKPEYLPFIVKERERAVGLPELQYTFSKKDSPKHELRYVVPAHVQEFHPQGFVTEVMYLKDKMKTGGELNSAFSIYGSENENTNQIWMLDGQLDYKQTSEFLRRPPQYYFRPTAEISATVKDSYM